MSELPIIKKLRENPGKLFDVILRNGDKGRAAWIETDEDWSILMNRSYGFVQLDETGQDFRDRCTERDIVGEPELRRFDRIDTAAGGLYGHGSCKAYDFKLVQEQSEVYYNKVIEIVAYEVNEDGSRGEKIDWRDYQ